MGATCGSKAGVADGGTFLKTMAKNEFRLQRGTGDQGGKTQYRHTDIPFQYTHTINPSVLEMVWLSHPPIGVLL
jgi:hypothetical protein